MSYRTLNVPFCEQKSDSAACGPCNLKMVLDYYKCRQKRRKYTKLGLVKLARTSAEMGTSYVNMKRVLRRAGLKFDKIFTDLDIIKALLSDRPVIALVADPGAYWSGKPVEEYHYITIIGLELGGWLGPYFVYHDPYYGEYQRVSWANLKHMLRPENWLLEVYR